MMTDPVNPYRVGDPVYLDEEFFDRSDELAEILHEAKPDGSAAVVIRGPRRIGKTSVLLRAARRLRADNHPTAYVDLKDVDLQHPDASSGELVRAVLARITAQVTGPDGERYHLDRPDLYDTIDGFRESILPQVARAFPQRRLVVFLDETEVLMLRDENSAAQVISALHRGPTVRGAARPITIIAEGRTWSQSAAYSRQRSQLRSAKICDLGLFSKEVVRQLITQPVEGLYSFSHAAIEEIYAQCAGFPLLAEAIGYAVFEQRTAQARGEEVDQEDVRLSLSSALKTAMSSLVHARDQVEVSEQMLLLAMAIIAKRSGRPDRFATFGEMVDLLEVESHYRLPEAFESGVLENLIANFIVEQNHDQSAFRIKAPLLEAWIRSDTFPAIEIRATRRSPDAVKHYEEGLSYVNQSKLAEAKKSFEAALELNPAHWQAALELSAIDSAEDRLDVALTRVRALMRERPGNIEVERAFGKLLTAKAVERHSAGERYESERALREIREFDPTLSRFPNAEQLLLEHKMDDWQLELEKREPSEWRTATEKLAAGTAGTAWWRKALGVYCNRLREARPGDPSLGFALRLAREIFPVLVKHAAAAVVASDEDELKLAWALTLALLKNALHRPWDPEGERVPAALLEEMLFLPLDDQKRHDIETLSERCLAPRFKRTFIEDGKDAVSLVRTLARTPAALDGIRDALVDLALEHAADVTVADRFIRTAPGIYAILVDADRRLPHGERMTLLRDYREQIKLVLPVLTGAKLTVTEKNRDEWRQVLSHLAIPGDASLERLEGYFALPSAEPPNLVEERIGTRPPSPDRDAVASVLGSAYRLGEELQRAIAGVPSGAVRQYLAVKDPDDDVPTPVLVRSYSGRECSDGVQALLHWLWNTEYRALYSLSSRWEGRALPRLMFAHVDSKSQQYVLVSERIGPRSLRDELNEGRIAAFSDAERGNLWRHLHALADAIAGLHRLSLIHRAVRPENILLTPTGARSRARFRLTNFEWSIFLDTLTKYLPTIERSLTYHLPPEVLSLEFQIRDLDAPAGEGFGVDSYGLGLVFFECLVRRLHVDELRPLDSYNRKRHLEWLDYLGNQIDESVDNKNISSDEGALIKRMLDPDPRRREDDMDRIAGEVMKFATMRSGLAERLKARPLTVFTTLNPDEDSCIARFLTSEIALPEAAQKDSKMLARFIESELRGAAVFINFGSEERPLLLQGRRVAFTVKPFIYNEREYRRLAFLEVAKGNIFPEGDWVAKVGDVSVKPIHGNIEVDAVIAQSEWWEELFDLADEKLDDLGIEERRFLRQLSVTLAVDLRVCERAIYQCQIHDVGIAAGSLEQFVIIGAATGDATNRRSLREAVEDNVDRQINEFDLSLSPSVEAAFRREAQWIFAGFEGDDDLIRLVRPIRRLTPELPRKGELRFLRPWSLSPTRVLNQRHAEHLHQLRGDSYILRALTSPADVSHNLAPQELTFFDQKLDATKRDLIQRIHRARPIFLVQGPPGTGKTTMAREVVLQLLREQPGARILITSQGHEPLNNLLDKTEEAINEELKRREARLVKPVSVRLLAPEKQYGETATRIDRQYFPAEVAKDILQRAAAWRPGLNDVSDPDILRDWQAFITEQEEVGLSAALEGRLIEGANLVYATLNDRHLARFREDAFDLVIVEEAARAYPIELIGPMRLARRWLLIGDQQQLPPFGIQDFRAELRNVLEQIELDGGKVAHRHGGYDGIPAYLGFENSNELRNEIEDNVALFQTLYRKGERARQPISGLLRNQWRMHPTIAKMISDVFYKGELKTEDTNTLTMQRRHRLQEPKEIQGRALVWLDVPTVDQEPRAADEPAAGGGFVNAYEIRALQGFLRSFKGYTLDTAILSPYRGQVRLMQDKFFDTWQHPVTGPLADRVFTVDSFQGRQASLVAVSLVRNNTLERYSSAVGFVADRSRATVMFSRAERLLVVIGCSEHFKRLDRAAHQRNYVNQVYEFIKREGVVLSAYNYLRREDNEAMEAFHGRRRDSSWTR